MIHIPLKDMLSRNMSTFSWNTLLRLMYALCGWLALFSICNHRQKISPLDILGRWLDWLGIPSEFCITWAKWSAEHATLLHWLAFGIVTVSIVALFQLHDVQEMHGSIEITAILLALAIALQTDVSLACILGYIAIAWVSSIVSTHPQGAELFYGPPMRYLVWPLTLMEALLFPILVLIRLLFDGM